MTAGVRTRRINGDAEARDLMPLMKKNIYIIKFTSELVIVGEYRSSRPATFDLRSFEDTVMGIFFFFLSINRLNMVVRIIVGFLFQASL